MIRIFCTGRPSIPPSIHGYDFEPLDDSLAGRWAADIDPKDSALFKIDVPGSPFAILAPPVRVPIVLVPDAPLPSPPPPADVPPADPPVKTNEEILAEASALPKKAEIAAWAKEHLALDIDWQHTNRADCLTLISDHLASKG
jgi:hypothetical protein